MADDRESRPTLFRQEAVASSQDRWGTPSGIEAFRAWPLALLASALVSALVCGMLLIKIPRKVEAVGALLPTFGAADITVIRPGVLNTVHVSDGAQVTKGDLLLTFSLDSALADGRRAGVALGQVTQDQRAALSREIEQRVRALEQSRRDLDARVARLGEQLRIANRRLSIQSRQVELSQRYLNDIQPLLREQLVSEFQARQLEEQHLSAQQNLAALEAMREQAVDALAETRNKITAVDHDILLIRAQEANQLSQIVEKEIVNATSTEYQITAPVDGRLTGLRVREGETLEAGKIVGTILPLDPELQAELWVRSSAVGLLAPGTQVKIMYDAYPYQKYGTTAGSIVELAKSPTPIASTPDYLHADENLFRAVAAIEVGNVTDMPLVPGMRLRADIVLEDRSLLEWLVEPLIAFRRRNAG